MSQKIKLFLDLDGVLVDLHRGLKERLNFEFPSEHTDENRQKIHTMWYDISHTWPGFWSTLSPTKDYMVIYEACLTVDPLLLICSATPEPFAGADNDQCAAEKCAWVQEHLGFNQATRTIITKSKLKQTWMQAEAINILVDDHLGNIRRWNKAGGVGIYHTNLQRTLEELSKWK